MQHPVVQAGWRQAVTILPKMCREMPLDGGGKTALLVFGAGLRLPAGKLDCDRAFGDDFVRIEYDEPLNEIFEFANIPRPGVQLQTLKGGRIHALRRQPAAFRLAQEMTNQIRNVL